MWREMARPCSCVRVSWKTDARVVLLWAGTEGTCRKGETVVHKARPWRDASASLASACEGGVGARTSLVVDRQLQFKVGLGLGLGVDHQALFGFVSVCTQLLYHSNACSVVKDDSACEVL